ncbi:MAG: undecaprenyldiphospho-muramoylpentapeptide beta-N-acetylglucosaminyltransferase [Candidatus Marinimicrobia bacterium]|jgi:UDP-N-acetylglucosamine--N-acetylmuramyl-(pentapeptide) pyrophosphoryl-undecaprenol N-acetylglucosamine transferase|nr:undecaprenyldiphospho-muramoylpentapeptide beta-N-acetylglucosaminyltransferase [Candidatus Neomarinimicrobiota bacterium]MBT3634169.1 undecaprenyldiphospho-muramoylpentapeptide beta-N-acetylglucosaminyltransferase [Candidatus Neomarinimicrobiota bacterium]MBT3683206.1 undecaprenyldiphospho-muramoylpentapeptide beta-N-acetylglucosaminyltransferase [Candidatus Neomarinimicrobiota bacterium]MBT3759746.1 undecaprenyldiphospho-muramoylpentapeptide beta-N-acetylglucosaminyltransferase [Candidatus 
MPDSTGNQLRVIIAGGGTGGHLYPAISIADLLRRDGVIVRYIGSKFGIEAKNITALGESPLLLPITGIQRDLSFKSLVKNFLFPFRFIFSYFKSRSFIKNFNPQIVIGTGGYSSGIPLLNALKLKINTLIQEQNSYPGITTRNLAGKVNTVCIAFDESSSYLSGNLIKTGNPVRDNLIIMSKEESRKQLGLEDDRSTIFILGGSQGSRPFNTHFKEYYKQYISKGFQLLWQYGYWDENMLESVKNEDHVHLFPFIENMSTAYGAADLVISRAGAITLAEITKCHKAAILIPFPHAAGNHQEVNARSLESKGASILVHQSELKTGKLENTVFDLFENIEKITQLEIASADIAIPEATKNIIKEIYKLV